MESWKEILAAIVSAIGIMTFIAKLTYPFVKEKIMLSVKKAIDDNNDEQEKKRKLRSGFYEKEFGTLQEGVTTIITKLDDLKQTQTEHDVEIKNIKEDIKELKRGG